MKTYKIISVLLIISCLFTGCKTEFENVNNPTEEIVLGTKEGLFALAIGLRQYYSMAALRYIIEAQGITTRELNQYVFKY